jgi:hypothetical protein
MSSYPSAQRRRRITILVAGGVLFAMIVAVALAATSGLSKTKGPSGTKTAHGIVSIVNKADYVVQAASGTSSTAANQPCHGTGDFTDISTGGLVTITDGVGRQLATASLSQGSVDPNGFCVFSFDAPVAIGRGPYGVQITRRKVVQVNESDLFSLITLTLGA